MNAHGRVLQVNVSRGGVPKLPIERGTVTKLGIEGDGHRESSHGGPDKALCLFAGEAIERLQAEGHPVRAGSTGENLTTRGVEWSTLPVGTRARIGGSVVIELTAAAAPCGKQRENFRGGAIERISIRRFPADSRMYARVLEEGEIRPGDPIHLLAAD